MKTKKSLPAAFTLIELLVVITIIGILAGIALPVFNSVQVRGSQTKSLAQAKQIGLALKIFAGDNDGVYPASGTPTALTTITTSNDAFAALFPQYLSNEAIFGNKLVPSAITPDNAIDNPYTGTRTKTLKMGENVYGYMGGLTDSSNSDSPIVFDNPSATGTYSNAPGTAGSVWSGTKAVCIRLDNSGALENLLTSAPGSPTASIIKVSDRAGSGAYVNALDTAQNPNLSTTANRLYQADLTIK